jgi:hypothetical protein
MFTHPAPQLPLGQIKISGSLSHSDAALCYQPHCLDLELAAELPSWHKNSSVPWS